MAIALWYWNQRDYDGATAWAVQALEIDPRHGIAREFLAGAYLQKGDVDRYVAEAMKHAVVHGVPNTALEPMKNAYMSGGRAGLVAYSIQQLSSGAAEDAAVQLAMLYGDAGDLDAAFLYLNRAIDRRDPALLELAVGPQFDRLRADPRFETCLTRMGLRIMSTPRS